MVKGSILFPIDKKIDLAKLAEAIRTNRNWPKWETALNKRGFSGLDMDQVDFEGVMYNRVLVIWTDDGKNGYVRENLTATQITRIKEVIASHVG